MAAAQTQAREKRKASGSKGPDGLRRCLATGEMLPREQMIRFVLGPDNTVVPDLSENLPGAGLWVSATAEAIQQAVKKNLFSKASKQPAQASSTLTEDVVKLLKKRCLNYLGQAKGAGLAVLGETQTEAALRAKEVDLFLRAHDATRMLDNRHHIAEYTHLTREELGAAFGYSQIVYAGLAPHRMTKKIMMEFKRLRSMTEGAIDEAKEDFPSHEGKEGF